MDAPIVIIGAGVAGLVAARHLEAAGCDPVVIEASDRAGGRVKTDLQTGFRLDHGFQVLLTAYRETKTYLDLEALDLKGFLPGAIVYAGGQTFRISDPNRQPDQLLPMAFSPVGSLKDKWLMWKLNSELKRTDPEVLFEETPQSTMQYLRDYGFSERMIDRFFRPFFGGIFLENELRTGAAMFRFVFKMFGEGFAALPARGMEQIPLQLQAALNRTVFRFDERVARVEGKHIYLEGGETLAFSRLIIATDPFPLLPSLEGQELNWETTCNLYFKASYSPLDAPLIALVAEPGRLINNWCVLTDVSRDYGPENSALISVTLKEIPDGSDQLVAGRIAGELADLTGRADLYLEFLARYDIRRALPHVDALRYDVQVSEAALTGDIFLAGDYLLNASLDAAMRSGRNAAAALLQTL